MIELEIQGWGPVLLVSPSPFPRIRILIKSVSNQRVLQERGTY